MPSKQEQTKMAQGYRTVPQNCGNCQHRSSEMKLAKWMERRNQQAADEGRIATYSLATYGAERNHRCGVGGFAVKVTATCASWTPVAA
jgi:hypothetical protein